MILGVVCFYSMRKCCTDNVVELASEGFPGDSDGNELASENDFVLTPVLCYLCKLEQVLKTFLELNIK